MMTRVFIAFLTARLIWLAVLISIDMTAIALNVGENLSVKQIVDQTRAMSLRGERFQAQNHLVLALNNSKISMRDRTIVKVALNELSRQFFSDKALAIFELGESNLYARRNREALERYREAQDLEPENTTIFSARVRALLAQGDCAEAEKFAAQSIALQPYDEMLKLIQLRSQICTGQSTLFQKRWDSELGDLEKNYGQAVAWFRILAAHHRSKHSIKSLRQISMEHPDFPEPRYYLFLQATDPQEKRTRGEEYVSLCKKSDHLVRRRFIYEPQMCEHVQTVEDILAKGDPNR
jgi:tetratricopeptide (TPR) repeat protein